MPVFRVCRHINDISGFQFDRFFSPKLSVSASCSCDKYLTAAGLGMMNVPMVSASGFKSNGSYRNLFRRKQVAIALSVEILRISVIFAAFLKNHIRFHFLYFAVLKMIVSAPGLRTVKILLCFV